MPLSDQEKRVLDEIERGLLDDDRRLADAMRRGPGRSRSRLLPLAALACMFIGLGGLVYGLAAAHGVFAVAGFVLLVCGLWGGIRLLGRRSNAV
jgi:hypothetical protein